MRSEIYITYAPSTDMTFIMEDTYNGDTLVSTEVKGFYYGESDDDATISYNGKLKAIYEEVE